jgi:hypothetical protein
MQYCVGEYQIITRYITLYISKEQSPWEVNSRLGSQEIPRIFWNIRFIILVPWARH